MICIKCKNDKNIDEFLVRNKKKYTYFVSKKCKSCKLQEAREYKKRNKLDIKEQRKEYHKKNKEKIKKYKNENPHIVKKCRKNYYNKNKENIIKSTRYQKALRRYLLCKVEGDKYRELIDCTPNQFKKWIASQFVGEMTMENYGKTWEMDHVVSQIFFDIENKKELLLCHNWKNIRPCLITNNKVKKDKIILYDNVLHELKLYHYNASLLFEKDNIFQRTQVIPVSKKEIHRENPHPSAY